MQELVLQPKYYELIKSALELSGGTHTYADIVEGVTHKRYQFWPGTRSCIVTEVVQYPRKKVCHCFLAAGDLDEIMSMRTWVENWAGSIGCQLATINGRKGWAKVLADEGYSSVSYQLQKDLGGK